MFKKILCLSMAGLMMCSPLVTKAGAWAIHTHNFVDEKMVDSEETGSYGHYYVYGYDANGNAITRVCNVIVETEYYTYECNVEDCTETYGSFTKELNCHSSCGAGEIYE